VPVVDLPEEEEMAAAVACIDAWIARELATEGLLVAGERQDVTDRTASYRWYLRFKGEEKDFITVWLTLQQRTLHHEAQFMPAPEENKADVYAYLMRRNAHLFGMWFALGPEDAVYLVGRVPAALIDDDELDRIAGSSVIYVDDHFPSAMTMAMPGVYHRRPRRS
jgi:Putative bacterial sensory transduction regulator